MAGRALYVRQHRRQAGGGCVCESGKPSILGGGTGGPGIICPLSLYIMPSRDKEEMKVAFSPSASLNVGAM